VHQLYAYTTNAGPAVKTMCDTRPLSKVTYAGTYEKIAIFDQYLALSQNWYKIQPQLLWNANRKPCPSFRALPFPM